MGFEPTVRCRTLVFKTSAFDRSATLPNLVLVAGFEPAIFWSQTRRLTRLGHTKIGNPLADTRWNVCIRPLRNVGFVSHSRMPRVHSIALLCIWHRCRESNPGPQFWRLMCYRNTSPTFFYEYTPSLSDLLLSAMHTAECTHKKSP